ncbi:hypothetical protein GMMP15_1600012 [Candidatus Magnetomoraceae bacterium gMMP-15]
MILRINEIGKKYKIFRSTLRDWEEKGLIKVHKTPGGHRRYLESDIQEVLNINRY